VLIVETGLARSRILPHLGTDIVAGILPISMDEIEGYRRTVSTENFFVLHVETQLPGQYIIGLGQIGRQQVNVAFLVTIEPAI